MFGAQTAPEVDKLTDTGSKLEANATASKDAILGLKPDVENIYAQLAAQLQQTYEQDRQAKEVEKKNAIGAQKVEASKSGFEPTSGFEAALIGSIEKAKNADIATLSTKFNIDSKALAAEEQKDIKQLTIDALAAERSGLTGSAQITGQIIQIKQAQQSLVQQAANTIMTAQTAEEAQYFSNLYQDATLGLKKQELALTAQKMADDKAYNYAALAVKQKEGGAGTKEYEIQAQGRAQLSDIISKAGSQGMTQEQLKSTLNAAVSGGSPIAYLSPTEVQNAILGYTPPAAAKSGGIADWASKFLSGIFNKE